MKSFDGSGVQVVTQGQVLEADTTAVAASAASSASQPSASADASAQASSDNGCTDAPPAGSTCAKQKVGAGWYGRGLEGGLAGRVRPASSAVPTM